MLPMRGIWLAFALTHAPEMEMRRPRGDIDVVIIRNERDIAMVVLCARVISGFAKLQDEIPVALAILSELRREKFDDAPSGGHVG